MTQPIVINFPAVNIEAIFTESNTVIPAGSPFPLNGGSITNIFTDETHIEPNYTGIGNFRFTFLQQGAHS